jgi:hypothetical protein
VCRQDSSDRFGSSSPSACSSPSCSCDTSDPTRRCCRDHVLNRRLLAWVRSRWLICHPLLDELIPLFQSGGAVLCSVRSRLWFCRRQSLRIALGCFAVMAILLRA